MYKVISDLKLKVQGVIKVFHAGGVINLPEKSAQMFIQQGKIVPVPEEPIARNDELTESEAESLNERMAIMGENCEPEEAKPYVTDYGILVIPWNSARKYHYWNEGQSVCDTLKELGRCDLIEKYKSIYCNYQN